MKSISEFPPACLVYHLSFLRLGLLLPDVVRGSIQISFYEIIYAFTGKGIKGVNSVLTLSGLRR